MFLESIFDSCPVQNTAPGIWSMFLNRRSYHLYRTDASITFNTTWFLLRDIFHVSRSTCYMIFEQILTQKLSYYWQYGIKAGCRFVKWYWFMYTVRDRWESISLDFVSWDIFSFITQSHCIQKSVSHDSLYPAIIEKYVLMYWRHLLLQAFWSWFLIVKPSGAGDHSLLIMLMG